MTAADPVLITDRLEEAYGSRRWTVRHPPLEMLIATILSQHTNDRNSGAAMDRLEARFEDWDAVADADLPEIADAIRVAGLHRQKAETIRRVLRRLREERGEVDLEFLRGWPDKRVADFLEDLPGVGPKTAACVLLFSLKRPVLPVDTHVHRVSRRLGLIDEGTSAEKAHRVLAEMVPTDRVYTFHVLVIEHGRKTCKARVPRCCDCPVEDLCPGSRC